MAYVLTACVLANLIITLVLTVVLTKIVQMEFVHTTFVLTNLLITLVLMEQHALKNVNKCLNTNIDSYSETSGG